MATASHILQITAPDDILHRMAANETFVVNIVAAWCPDCSERQIQHIDGFADKLQAFSIDVLQVNVQQQRGEFISAAHQQLTEQFGGHGYPRTVFINRGEIADRDNVEVVTAADLAELADKFIKMIDES